MYRNMYHLRINKIHLDKVQYQSQENVFHLSKEGKILLEHLSSQKIALLLSRQGILWKQGLHGNLNQEQWLSSLQINRNIKQRWLNFGLTVETEKTTALKRFCKGINSNFNHTILANWITSTTLSLNNFAQKFDFDELQVDHAIAEMRLNVFDRSPVTFTLGNKNLKNRSDIPKGIYKLYRSRFEDDYNLETPQGILVIGNDIQHIKSHNFIIFCKLFLPAPSHLGIPDDFFVYNGVYNQKSGHTYLIFSQNQALFHDMISIILSRDSKNQETLKGKYLSIDIEDEVGVGCRKVQVKYTGLPLEQKSINQIQKEILQPSKG